MPRRPFSLDAIITRACEAERWADFGPGGWQEGLDVLLGCLNEEMALTPLGRNIFASLLARTLRSRLRIVKWASEHPELVARRVERPIVIAGMGRAGTTLLSCLLDRDERLRSLLNWEVVDPTPPPSPEELRSGPRVEAAVRRETVVDRLDSGLRAIHFERATSPTECLALLGQHFLSLTWLFGCSPTYSRWLLAADHTSAYEYHRLALQVLQARTTSSWSLKGVQHVLALDALTSIYPDARLVIMHRDPVAMVASTCSLINSLTRIVTTVDCRRDIASGCLALFDAAITRSRYFVERHPRWPIVDIRYHEFVRDPIRTVRRVYEGFDEVLPARVERMMRRYLADHPQAEFGHHRYSLGDLGLGRAEIEERFAAYRERYQLTRELVPG